MIDTKSKIFKDEIKIKYYYEDLQVTTIYETSLEDNFVAIINLSPIGKDRYNNLDIEVKFKIDILNFACECLYQGHYINEKILYKYINIDEYQNNIPKEIKIKDIKRLISEYMLLKKILKDIIKEKWNIIL